MEHQQARIEQDNKSETTMVEENEIEQEEETDLSLADLRSNLRNQIVPQLASTLFPLTSAENALVEDALFSQERMRRGLDILGRFASHVITRYDMETLRPIEFLNDAIINYFIKVLTYRDMHLSSLCEGRNRSHFFSSFFFNKFSDGHTDMRRWAKKVPGRDIFKLDKLFLICNVDRCHWTCAVAKMQDRRIEYYDSLSGDGSRFTSIIRKYIHDEWTYNKGGGQQLPQSGADS